MLNVSHYVLAAGSEAACTGGVTPTMTVTACDQTTEFDVTQDVRPGAPKCVVCLALVESGTVA